MGALYLADDPTLPRQIALKVLSSELSRDPDFRARFIREAETAAALEHPQIVSVYNRGHTVDGQLWIAMQFVDGIDADAALRQGTWIATALGRTDTAKTLLGDAASQQSSVKSAHPAFFSGKSIVAVNYTGTTTTAAAQVSPPTSYLQGIGFTYSTHYKRGPADPPDVPFDIGDFDYVGQRSDILLLLRTDPGAGGGGYAGLPATYSGSSTTPPPSPH